MDIHPDCYFCTPKLFSINKKLNLPTYNSIIYEDENVFIMPDLAPICLGHFLIVSKRHINSFGNSDDKTFKSLKKAEQFIVDKCYETDTSILFEHGAVIPGTAGASIDHAHMHSLPGKNIFIDDYLAESGLSLPEKVMASDRVLQEFALSGQPYIYYRDISGAWARPVQKLPHQFFRFLLSTSKKNYHWMFSHSTTESIKAFMDTLALYKDK